MDHDEEKMLAIVLIFLAPLVARSRSRHVRFRDRRLRPSLHRQNADFRSLLLTRLEPLPRRHTKRRRRRERMGLPPNRVAVLPAAAPQVLYARPAGCQPDLRAPAGRFFPG